MSISYTIDLENGCTRVTCKGAISASVLGDHWRRYLADPVVMATRRTMVDLRECRILFSGEQLAHLVESIVLPLLNGKDWTTAIVVGDPDQVEISRQYHALAESYSRDSIFSTPEAAMEWLLAQHA
jgi:hypothetical protein